MIRTTSGRLAHQGLNTIFRTASFIPKKHFKRNQTSSTQKAAIPSTDYYSNTDGYVRVSPFGPIVTPDITLDQYVWKNLSRWEKKVATVCVVTGREYTFAQARDCSAALAVRLQKLFNLQPRDVIAICMPNLPEYPIAALGSLEAGLTVTTVNPIYTADEIARQLNHSLARFVICTAAGYSVVKAACDLTKRHIPIACIRTSKSEQLPADAVDFFELINPQGVNFGDLLPTGITENDLAFLPFSSGTTGMPKGVMLSHANITSNCEQVQAKVPNEPYIRETNDTCQEVIPCVLPFFHIYGLTVCMLSKLHLGCKLVTLPKFTPDDLLKSLHEYKGTNLNLVPPIILFLTHSPKVQKEHCAALRCVMTGAAPIGQTDVDNLLAKFPHVIVMQGYGMTESSPVVLLTPNENRKYASVGFLTGSTEAKIVSFDTEDGIGLGPNTAGELCVRGPQVMKGYLNDEKSTQGTFYPGNWLRTGDVGHYDEEGYFYITDRMKELIKVKGFQVAPAELEAILRNHEKIVDAAVIGIPDPASGEVPKAVVVLRPDCTATEKEIQDYVAGKVAHFKHLEGGVDFVTEIPKNLSGKILRRELKAKYVKQ